MDKKSELFASIGNVRRKMVERRSSQDVERYLDDEIVGLLREAGIFRLFVPRSLGGLELNYPDGLDVICELSKIDGSVGWIAMIGAGSGAVVPLLSPETYSEMYANGPDVILAGAVQPSGTAEKISKGWLVKGRWPLASGARHAQWLLGMCIMTEDGKSLPNPRSGAAPWARFFALPASQWNIEDTWYSLGLRGTGSTHVSLSGTVVPEKNFFDLGGKPSVEGPLYSYPQVLIPTFHAAVHLGIAEGAIDDLVEIVKAKVSGPGALTKDSELFNAELGRISTDATAARTVMRATAKELWRDIERSNSNAAELASRAVQMAVWTSNLCDEITDRCYVLSGSQSIYDGSSLQRRLRDSKTASQHAAIRATKYIDIGKARLSTAQAVSPGEA